MADQRFNPYAAPRSIDPQVSSARRNSLAPLRIPSAALLILASLWGIAWLHAIFVHVVFVSGSQTLLRIAAGGQANLNFVLVSLAACAFIAFGALMMRRGKCYRLSMAAAIIACIPALSPWIYIGIPFGIWAVIVLRRPSVRAAFADATERYSDRSN
jgi:hypothetical protein